MNPRRSVLLLGILLLLPSLFLPSGTSFAFTSPQESTPVTSSGPTDQDATQIGLPTDQIILKYKTPPTVGDVMHPASADEMQRLSEAAGVSLTYVREMSGDAQVLGLPSSLPLIEVQAIAERLSTLPEVAYAEPDAIMTHMLTPNDPRYGDQWHYFAPGSGHYGINAPAAWDITTGSSSIVVAVVDTGITNHADLSGRTVPGYDFISEVAISNDGDGRDSNPSDPGDWVVANECYAGSSAFNSSWHGTHTAGTIGAASNNGVGVAGVNWQSKILPVRVLGKCGGTTSDITDGMRWAAGLSVPSVPNNSNVAKVLNLSLGGNGACSITYQNAVNAIVSAGSTVVVSAGNSNTNASGFQPGNCTGVITVAATNRNGSRAFYSNYGAIVEISAPGGEVAYPGDSNGVLSTLNTGTQGPGADTYAYYQGTSMAAPHIAGVVSLMLSRNPTLTPTQILNLVQSTVTNFPGGSTCNTSLCGSGIVNAGAAVAAVPTGVTKKTYLPLASKGAATSLAAPVLSAISNGDGDGNYNVTWSAVSGAMSYLLQEDDNSGFSSPATAYNGANTSWMANGKPNGIYFYRVQALGGAGNSGWSNTQSATVNIAAGDFVNGDFEQGTTGWTEYSSHGWDVITQTFPTSITAHSGSWAAWLGGENDETSYIEQRVTVPATRPYLRYYHWIASEDACGYDNAYVLVNGSIVSQYELCGSQVTGGWVNRSVNLNSYAGQSILLRIRVTTDGSLNSNLLVDDVSFQSSASSATIPVASDGDQGAEAAKATLLENPASASQPEQ